MKKYVFKPYSKIFPELFLKEKERIASHIKKALAIEHIGSTSVPNLGGKGIIDIAIAVHREDMDSVSLQLQSLGYEFRPAFSTPDRFYFIIYLPDPEEGKRRYHLHLTYPENREWGQFIGFRDYLRNHPDEVEEYAALKRLAADEANQEGERYRKIKEPMFKKVSFLMAQHPDDKRFIIEEDFVHRLVAAQFPQWKDLPIKAVSFSGWDNRTFHLGDRMLIRMPSAAEYALQVEKEQHWLPKLAPFLPLPIPLPLAVGEPMDGYPWKWSIYSWLEGETAASGHITDLCEFAVDLAKFLKTFQSIDWMGGPLAGLHSFYRGGSLMTYDAEVRQALAALEGKIDIEAAAKVWETALATVWNGKPVWVHGDISAGNLLVKNGRLFAVIDFGQLAIGDPACDLAIAWTFLKGKSREAFQKEIPLDEGTWSRGRAWTLWKSLVVAAGFTNPNNFESTRCWDIIKEVLEEI
jgi:aminoglycoside phosphotransferase (APT) family kinase protein/GrpB-like predicted nucleotidyltransferase (UPF0157 family)